MTLYNTSMRQQLLIIDKPRGMIPLAVIKKIKQQQPTLRDQPIGYAGRLDPLAHGVLILMVGEETTKQRETYLNLPKEYEFEAVFGLSTDTYDALGIPTVIAKSENRTTKSKIFRGGQSRKLPNVLSITRNDIEKFIHNKLGKHRQPYPPFSSKTVNGKPLFWWTKNHKLHEIDIPTREIEIYNFVLLETATISAKKLKKEIFEQIDSVSGDFRQNEIKNAWQTFFQNDKITDTFQTATFHISCSSGTYVRSLVNELGNHLGTEAMTRDILRTKVGEYTLFDTKKI